MTGILFNASGKIERNIVEALLAIRSEAMALQIPFFLMGAFARDLLLFHQQGIAGNRIEAVAFGESTPIATNETEAGRGMNRRVEIKIAPQSY